MLDYQNDKFLSGLCPVVRSQRYFLHAIFSLGA